MADEDEVDRRQRDLASPSDIGRELFAMGAGVTSRALLIGVDEYDIVDDLSGCAADAAALAPLLARHDNGRPNFDCRLAAGAVRRDEMLTRLDGLLAPGADVALFYFAGHGKQARGGVALATTDWTVATPGVAFREVLERIAASPVREVVVILDCCFSGGAGALALLDSGSAVLRSGVSILAASRGDQVSWESHGRGQFSVFLEAALDGGAADVLGNVTVASVYAFLSESFGAWDQRPTFKANIERLHPLRHCRSVVDVKTLRLLVQWFPTPDHVLELDPSYEPDALPHDPVHEAVFAQLQDCRASKLVEPAAPHQHLYYAAIESGRCRLTAPTSPGPRSGRSPRPGRWCGCRSRS